MFHEYDVYLMISFFFLVLMLCIVISTIVEDVRLWHKERSERREESAKLCEFIDNITASEEFKNEYNSYLGGRNG